MSCAYTNEPPAGRFLRVTTLQHQLGHAVQHMAIFGDVARGSVRAVGANQHVFNFAPGEIWISTLTKSTRSSVEVLVELTVAMKGHSSADPLGALVAEHIGRSARRQCRFMVQLSAAHLL